MVTRLLTTTSLPAKTLVSGADGAPEGWTPNPRFSGILIHRSVFLTAAHTVLQFKQNVPWPFTDRYVSFAPDVRVRNPLLEREIAFEIRNSIVQETHGPTEGHRRCNGATTGPFADA